MALQRRIRRVRAPQSHSAALACRPAPAGATRTSCPLPPSSPARPAFLRLPAQPSVPLVAVAQALIHFVCSRWRAVGGCVAMQEAAAEWPRRVARPPASSHATCARAAQHSLLSHRPGSDGRKVAMRLLGKWRAYCRTSAPHPCAGRSPAASRRPLPSLRFHARFAPDVAYATGGKMSDPQKPLIAFASPVALTVGGERNPRIESILARGRVPQDHH